jgi:hypothetical protein
MTTVIKTTSGAPTYALTDAHGNTQTVKQGQKSFVGASPTITLGGLVLTQQTVADLLPTLTAFSLTGVVS